MSFLNPLLLAFSAAIAVPIIIHLLNRRRFRRVSWAAMRFLRSSVEKNRRRMQWEDLILLLLRCLVLLLLALALARPALRAASAFLETGRAAAVVILDHSASLTASDGTQTRFDLARTAAEAVIDSYPAGSALAILRAGNRVDSDDALVEPGYEINLSRKTLREARPSNLGTDHLAGISRAAELLRDQTALRKEIVLVTDTQALGWRRFPEITSVLADMERDTRFRVVLVGEPLDDNLAISALTRSAGFASATEPVRFQAEIINRGQTAVRQARATLHVDHGPPIDEAVIDVLEPGQTRRLTFFARLGTPGSHAVAIRLPADRLPADDERVRVVQAVDQVRILVVDGDPESNSAFFLRNALQPVPAEMAAEYFIQPRVITPGELVLTRLSDHEAILLADIASLSAPAVEALTRYVREGGAVLWFPGPKSQPAFHNDVLAPFGMSPATLGEIRGDATEAGETFSLEPGRYQHPVFSLWNDAGAGSLTAAKFRAAWTLLPAPARTNESGVIQPGEVMIRYADGAPAAVEGTLGRGRVILFSSTAGTAWNDLAVRPAFVPLLHRAVAALAEAREARFNIETGGRMTLRLGTELTGRDVVITTPGVPELRVTRALRPGPEGAVLEFDETGKAGAYRVALAGESTPIALFAAQADPEESDLAEITPAQREEIARVAQVIDWTPGQDLRAAFEHDRVGQELWIPLAFAVLLLGLTETWFAQRCSRSK